MTSPDSSAKGDAWAALVGEQVVVDTDSHFVYLGTLDRVDDQFVVLKEVDAHDVREGPSTKEQYVMDMRKFGVKPNRREIAVRKAMVVSVSKLSDVLPY